MSFCLVSQVLNKYLEFKAAARLRREKLEDSRRFQYFRRDADELESWINEKLPHPLQQVLPRGAPLDSAVLQLVGHLGDTQSSTTNKASQKGHWVIGGGEVTRHHL